MDSLYHTGQVLKLVLGISLYLLISYALPRELMRASLRKHYREWIASTAYWRRHCDKWIVGRRVFYPDELWNDIFISALYGIFLGMAGTKAFIEIAELDNGVSLLLPTILSTAVLLFVLAQFDRVLLIDEEIKIKKLIDPDFNDEHELRRLLTEDRKWVKRIIGNQSFED